MDVGFLFLVLLLTVILEAELMSVELCKFKYMSNCRRNGSRLDCDVSSLYCNKVIECNEGTTINILKVFYGPNRYVNSKCMDMHCQDVCNGDVLYSQTKTSRLMDFCNGKQFCELSQWDTYNFWRLDVKFDCKESITLPKTSLNWITTKNASPMSITTPIQCTTKINTTPMKSQSDSSRTQVATTSPHPPKSRTSSNDADTKTNENLSLDQFPVPAVAASVSAGIIVVVIVLIVVVCMRRRRIIIKSNQPDETTLHIQIVAKNSYGYSPPSVNRQDQQDIDEHAYVDITLENATDTADGKFEHRFVNVDKEVDTNDEYNTLNISPTPFRIDPNYDHLPNNSHTPIDETYSYVTDGQTTMPDATYSHLKDTKPAASRTAKSN